MAPPMRPFSHFDVTICHCNILPFGYEEIDSQVTVIMCQRIKQCLFMTGHKNNYIQLIVLNWLELYINLIMCGVLTLQIHHYILSFCIIIKSFPI